MKPVGKLWDIFKKASDGETAECTLCGKILKTPKGSTSGPHGHLESMHKMVAPKRGRKIPRKHTYMNYVHWVHVLMTNNNVAPPATGENVHVGAKATALAVLGTESIEGIISKLTACDGIAFSVFRTSTVLRECIEARARELGLREVLPRSDSGVKSAVNSYANRARELTKKVATQTNFNLAVGQALMYNCHLRCCQM